MQSGIICEVCVCPLHIYSSVASKKDLSLLSPVCVYSWGFLQIYFWWHQQHKASPFLLVHVTYCSPQLHSYLPSYESKWELDLACSGKVVGNKTWLKWSLILFTKWCCKPECQRSRSGEVCNWRCPWHLSCKRKERRAEQCNNEWPKQPNRTKITPFRDFFISFLNSPLCFLHLPSSDLTNHVSQVQPSQIRSQRQAQPSIHYQLTLTEMRTRFPNHSSSPLFLSFILYHSQQKQSSWVLPQAKEIWDGLSSGILEKFTMGKKFCGLKLKIQTNSKNELLSVSSRQTHWEVVGHRAVLFQCTLKACTLSTSEK